VADASVAGVAAIAAKHLPQATLRHHYALARGLFEQSSGQVLDLRLVAQARAVEQPQGHFQRKALGGRHWRRISGDGEVFTAKLHDQQRRQLERRATLLPFFRDDLSISAGLKKNSMIFS
jgi:hypothetical protein